MVDMKRHIGLQADCLMVKRTVWEIRQCAFFVNAVKHCSLLTHLIIYRTICK